MIEQTEQLARLFKAPPRPSQVRFKDIEGAKSNDKKRNG